MTLEMYAESLATAMRRFRGIADCLEFLAGLPGQEDFREGFEIAARSIRDALAGNVAFCCSSKFLSERGL